MTQKDHDLSHQMTDYLCYFAKTGDPNKGSVLPKWIASDAGQKRVIRLGKKPSTWMLVKTMLTNKAVGE